MTTLEIKINQLPGPDATEMAIALLTAEGFEGFCEDEGTLYAYIGDEIFDCDTFTRLGERYPAIFGSCTITLGTLEDQNWNALWESNFSPVEIDGHCRIRAPFHPSDIRFPLELIIEPRMAFGTGHHQTTTLMVRYLLQHPPKGLNVLDMGSGTGILAMVAKRLGADATVAIDNDEWAYRNTLDNNQLNDCNDIVVFLGGAEAIPDTFFDLVLANINRNILLADMAVYCRHLAPGGKLVMSGFYQADLPAIEAEAEKNGLKLASHARIDEWTMAEFEFLT